MQLKAVEGERYRYLGEADLLKLGPVIDADLSHRTSVLDGS
nr:hypothetical protein [Rhodococcus qingshengii]